MAKDEWWPVYSVGDAIDAEICEPWEFLDFTGDEMATIERVFKEFADLQEQFHKRVNAQKMKMA
jgi:hypothetical protein